MIMKTLLNTNFFIQMTKDNDISIQNSYTDFIKKLLCFCKSEGDCASDYFILNYTRIEFVFLQNKITEYKSEKKMKNLTIYLELFK